MIYTIVTAKGGTGKTTTAAALAQAAAFKGKKALAIDLDPLGNLTFALNGRATAPGAYGLFSGERAPDLIQQTPQGVDLIPASLNLQTVTSAPGSARRLQDALRGVVSRYDLIIIDTPATAGELQYNALQAAERLIIPLEADAFCIQSLYQLIDTAGQFKASNKDLTIGGVLLNKYDGRPNLTKQMRQILENKLELLNIPFLGVVRKSIAAGEAAAQQLSLFEYAPKSNPAADYMDIYNNLVNSQEAKQ